MCAKPMFGFGNAVVPRSSCLTRQPLSKHAKVNKVLARLKFNSLHSYQNDHTRCPGLSSHIGCMKAIGDWAC